MRTIVRAGQSVDEATIRQLVLETRVQDNIQRFTY
jgi:hypothetical protein